MMTAAVCVMAIAFVCHLAICDYPPSYYNSHRSPPGSPVGSVYGPNSNTFNVSNNNSHHFQVGVPSYGNVLLYRQVQSKSGKLWRSVSREVRYPPVGTVNNRTISCVRVLDQYVNGQGGYASLLSGGVGWKNVTLLLKSQSSKGFNFLIEIWAY